jgi:hypothetical protein
MASSPSTSSSPAATQVPGFGGAYRQSDLAGGVPGRPEPTGAENDARSPASSTTSDLGHQVEVLPGRLGNCRMRAGSQQPGREAWDDIDEAINRVVIGWYTR